MICSSHRQGRRSELLKFHQQLCDMFPVEIQSAAFPPKKMLHSAGALEGRRSQLETYFKTVSRDSHIVGSKALNMFLGVTDDFASQHGAESSVSLGLAHHATAAAAPPRPPPPVKAVPVEDADADADAPVESAPTEGDDDTSGDAPTAEDDGAAPTEAVGGSVGKADETEDLDDALLPLSGWLMKKGGGTSALGKRNWKRRWFVLTKDKMEYAEREGAEPLGRIDMYEVASVAPVDGTETDIRITTERRVYSVRMAKNASFPSRLQWIQSIRRAKRDYLAAKALQYGDSHRVDMRMSSAAAGAMPPSAAPVSAGGAPAANPGAEPTARATEFGLQKGNVSRMSDLHEDARKHFQVRIGDGFRAPGAPAVYCVYAA